MEHIKELDQVGFIMLSIYHVLCSPYLLVDPVDDSGVLLGAVDRRLDAVLQQRVEDPVLLDGVGVHALEAPHRQLREPVRKPLALTCKAQCTSSENFIPRKFFLIEIVLF